MATKFISEFFRLLLNKVTGSAKQIAMDKGLKLASDLVAIAAKEDIPGSEKQDRVFKKLSEELAKAGHELADSTINWLIETALQSHIFNGTLPAVVKAAPVPVPAPVVKKSKKELAAQKQADIAQLQAHIAHMQERLTKFSDPSNTDVDKQQHIDTLTVNIQTAQDDLAKLQAS